MMTHVTEGQLRDYNGISFHMLVIVRPQDFFFLFCFVLTHGGLDSVSKKQSMHFPFKVQNIHSNIMV